MIRTRKGIKRWMAFPLFAAVVSATSVLAEVRVSHLGWVDNPDHLFRTVADRGAAPRPINGTVTETASQARTASRTNRALHVTTSASSVLRGSSGTVTESASGTTE